MKKGDIVQLKESTDFGSTVWHWHHPLGTKYHELSKSPVEQLTVKSTRLISACCMVYTIVSFEELGGEYMGQYFDIVLEAGEPDVNQLMEESKQNQTAWIGF